MPNLSDEAMAHLQTHPWPGNVRELEHLIRRAVVLCEGDFIEVSDLPLSADAAALLQTEPTPEGKSERQQLLEALRTCNWIVYGDRGAARLSSQTLSFSFPVTYSAAELFPQPFPCFIGRQIASLDNQCRQAFNLRLFLR